MHLSEIAVRLAALHESPGYAADRFDPGAELSGRVALLPSAFNPPTRAHVGLLELAASTAGIAQTAALLSTNNVDKSLFGAPLSHRVGMLLALSEAGEPAPVVLATNAARLVDQGEALRIRYPNVRFDFVVGFDTLVRVFDTRYYERMDEALARFFTHHRLIATNRAQVTVHAVEGFLGEPHVAPWARWVLVRELDERRATLSSSDARTHAAAGAPSDALTPPVADYIRRHGLYGSDATAGQDS